LLPFIVLPLYAGMRGINRDLLKAAANLGASPTRTFWQIFFPLSVPALATGSLIVFILCLGFYITPAVLGGGKVIMVSSRIANDIEIVVFPSPAGVGLMAETKMSRPAPTGARCNASRLILALFRP